MDDCEDEYCELNPSFLDCSCEHDSDAHGWFECLIEECECEGHWEE